MIKDNTELAFVTDYKVQLPTHFIFKLDILQYGAS